MKLNIAYPVKGTQKKVEIDDDGKLRAFFDKRLAQEVEGDSLGEEFKGYVFKIMGGQDKQGFPMKQGVLVPGRVQILMSPGAAELPGLTDDEKPRMRGPKRASKIRKLFALGKDDDVRKYVNTYRRKIVKGDKTHSKAPKIQRLVTPLTLQRKRHRRAIKKERINKSKAEAAAYHKLLVQRLKEQRERRSESLAKKRAVRMASQASSEAHQA